MLERLACLALNVLVGAAATPDPGSPDTLWLVALAVIIGHTFGHDRALQWWPPGARLLAVLFASAACLILLALAATLIEGPPGHERLEAVPAFFLPAHLAAWVWTLVRPRRAVHLEGSGPLRRRCRQVLEAGWGHGFRPARPDEDAPSVIPPRGHPADRSLRLQVGTHSLPLHPLGPESAPMRRLKRSLDLVVVLLGLPLLLPLWAIGALAVALRSGRPVHHHQVRWTRGRRAFSILKLRTMRRDAEPEGRPVWPRGEDPRITPVGRVLRHLWIDEIPQVLNVLSGHMSMVGPRPERPAFAEDFCTRMPIYVLRFQTPAGVTGLAQVQGFFGDTSIPKRARWDARYVERWSPLLDLWILYATARLVVRRSRRRGGDDGQGRGQEDPGPRREGS